MHRKIDKLMNKRLLLGSLAALGALSSVTAAEKKPNIIFILADDLGIGDVSTYNPGGKILSLIHI